MAATNSYSDNRKNTTSPVSLKVESFLEDEIKKIHLGDVAKGANGHLITSLRSADQQNDAQKKVIEIIDDDDDDGSRNKERNIFTNVLLHRDYSQNQENDRMELSSVNQLKHQRNQELLDRLRNDIDGENIRKHLEELKSQQQVDSMKYETMKKQQEAQEQHRIFFEHLNTQKQEKERTVVEELNNQQRLEKQRKLLEALNEKSRLDALKMKHLEEIKKQQEALEKQFRKNGKQPKLPEYLVESWGHFAIMQGNRKMARSGRLPIIPHQSLPLSTYLRYHKNVRLTQLFLQDLKGLQQNLPQQKNQNEGEQQNQLQQNDEEQQQNQYQKENYPQQYQNEQQQQEQEQQQQQQQEQEQEQQQNQYPQRHQNVQQQQQQQQQNYQQQNYPQQYQNEQQQQQNQYQQQNYQQYQSEQQQQNQYQQQNYQQHQNGQQQQVQYQQQNYRQHQQNKQHQQNEQQQQNDHHQQNHHQQQNYDTTTANHHNHHQNQYSPNSYRNLNQSSPYNKSQYQYSSANNASNNTNNQANYGNEDEDPFAPTPIHYDDQQIYSSSNSNYDQSKTSNGISHGWNNTYLPNSNAQPIQQSYDYSKYNYHSHLPHSVHQQALPYKIRTSKELWDGYHRDQQRQFNHHQQQQQQRHLEYQRQLEQHRQSEHRRLQKEQIQLEQKRLKEQQRLLEHEKQQQFLEQKQYEQDVLHPAEHRQDPQPQQVLPPLDRPQQEHTQSMFLSQPANNHESQLQHPVQCSPSNVINLEDSPASKESNKDMIVQSSPLTSKNNTQKNVDKEPPIKDTVIVALKPKCFSDEEIESMPVVFAFYWDDNESLMNASKRQKKWNEKMMEKRKVVSKRVNRVKTSATKTGPLMVSEGSADSSLPAGWTIKVFKRMSGKSKGHTDQYWYSPKTQKKMRSRVEIERFLKCLEESGGDEEEAYTMFKQR